MHELHTLPINPALWEAIEARASQDRVPPEAWLQSKLGIPEHEVTPLGRRQAVAPAEETLLDLALIHFRELNLDMGEARDLGNAIFATIETGEAHTVGPVSALQRHYAFHRRAAAVSIRIGEGQIRLPLNAAMRLATALHGPADLKALGRLAA